MKFSIYLNRRVFVIVMRWLICVGPYNSYCGANFASPSPSSFQALPDPFAKKKKKKKKKKINILICLDKAKEHAIVREDPGI